MSELVTPANPVAPKCPYCAKQPMRISDNMVGTPIGHAILIVWCSDCGAVMSATFAGQTKPMQLPDLSKLGLRM